MHHFAHRPTHSRHGHAIAVRIGGGHVKRQRRPSQHAGVRHLDQLWRLIGAELDVDLKVPRDLPNLPHDAKHLTPFLNANCDVVFPGNLGRVPREVTGDRIDGKHIIFRTELVRIHVGWDELSPKATAWHQAVGQDIAIRIVRCRIVNPKLIQTRIFSGRVEKLNAVVVSSLRVNDEQRLNGEWGVHGTRHVQDTLVSIGVLHGDGINPRTAVGVGAAIGVPLDVARQVDNGLFSFEAVQHVCRLVTPCEVKPGSVSQRTGFGVGGDDHFVGQALDMGVSDLSCPVVRGPSR